MISRSSDCGTESSSCQTLRIRAAIPFSGDGGGHARDIRVWIRWARRSMAKISP